jgi:hypothetical protein
MKNNIISLLISLVVGLILTGCNEDRTGAWEKINQSNTYSPMRSGEPFTVYGECLSTGHYALECTDISYSLKNNDAYKNVSYSCTYLNARLLGVIFYLKPSPLQSTENLTAIREISLNCKDREYVLQARFARNVTITPSSTAQSMITLSPGNQQKLMVTLPSRFTKGIGSKFTILESQQYLSFVGNESSCTFSYGQSSCSVTVQANSNVTTTVNQTLQVVTSELPTENVFIKIVPNTPPPTPTNKYIFVSQTTTAGNFGGFDQANTICNNDNARIDYPTQLGSGTFKALLNGNNATAIGTEYRNLADEVIATATTTNLVAQDTGLTNPIGKTPSGTQDGQYAWTGLASTATLASNCVNWTSASPGQALPEGTVGYVSVNYASWSVSSASPTSACWINNIHLYCVQQ